MKPLKLFMLVMLLSCNGRNLRHPADSQSGKGWTLINQTSTMNTYTTGGLLDTSFSTTVVCHNGKIALATKSMTVRKYSGNKLIRETDFDLSENGAVKELSSDRIKKYDAAGNLILDVRKMDGSVVEKDVNAYNGKGQVIKMVSLFRPPSFPDALLKADAAHANDQGAKEFPYDTTFCSYQYDASGNLVRALVSGPDGTLNSTHVNEYQGLQQTLSFDITPAGDTVSKFRYEYSGDLVKKIAVTSGTGSGDTVLRQNGKITMMITHIDERRKILKTVYKYNSRGDKTEVSAYEQEY